jgi:hypothetical protein
MEIPHRFLHLVYLPPDPRANESTTVIGKLKYIPNTSFRCMSNDERDVEEDLAYTRLNILLSKDSLRKLDGLKSISGLASRGRTIETLIDVVSQSVIDSKILQEHLKSNPNPTFEQTWPYILNILRRTWIFEPR